MNKIQTFQDIENFLVDYNQDGTPINKETHIYKFVKKKPIKHYKYINFKIISLFTIILLFIFIYNYLLLNNVSTDWQKPTEEKGDWEEQHILLMNGGKKLDSALQLIFRCQSAYFSGSNKRNFERWYSAQDVCREVLYYIRYGGF